MTSDTHGCPGGCGLEIKYARLACPACWSRLPLALRALVTEAHRARQANPAYRAAHLAAVSNALAWYKANRKPVES